MTRKEKLREARLSKISDEIKKAEMIKKYEWIDYCESIYDESRIGEEVICECGEKFIVSNNIKYCKSCLLKQHRIFMYGSYENFIEKSQGALKASLKEKYGVENAMQLSETKKKAKTSKKEKYGEHLEGITSKIQQTKLEKYGDKNYCNRDKIKSTNLEKYGTTYGKPLKESMIEKYGVENPMQLEEFRKKGLSTKKEKYGKHLEGILTKSVKTKKEKYGEHLEGIVSKTRDTLLKVYGVDNINKLEEFKKANSERMKKENPMFIDEYKQKMIDTMEAKGGFNWRNSFRYDDLFFDSSWELYYYLYLKLHNIDFIYKPPRIEYTGDSGKKSYYLPDFFTDHFVEIKGDNLIDENGILMDWDGNKYFNKTKLLQEIGAEILTKKDLIDIFEEIDAVYGKDFVKKFKE